MRATLEFSADDLREMLIERVAALGGEYQSHTVSADGTLCVIADLRPRAPVERPKRIAARAAPRDPVAEEQEEEEEDENPLLSHTDLKSPSEDEDEDKSNTSDPPRRRHPVEVDNELAEILKRSEQLKNERERR